MDTKSMTRKEFVTLTFTLLGGAATAAACSSSNNSTGTGGTNGAAGTAGGACTDPLPDTMVADDTMHMHTLTIQASALDAAGDQTLTTGPVIDATGTIAPHTHMVTLSASAMSTLKGGGSVTVPTQVADGHMHTYMVSCHAAGTGAAGTSGAAGNGAAGNGSAGANGAAGTNGAAGANGAAGNGAAGLTGAAGH